MTKKFEPVKLDERFRFYIPKKVRKDKDLQVGDTVNLCIRIPEDHNKSAGADILIEDERYRVTVFSHLRKILGIAKPREIEICLD